MAELDALPEIAGRPGPATPEEFREIIAAEAPVVLTGLIESWPALAAGRDSQAALNAYLKAMDGGTPGPVMEAPPRSRGRFAYGPDIREFNFTKRRAGVSETLDRIERLTDQPNAPYVAMQMLPLASHLPGFASANPMTLLPDVPPRLWVGGRVKTQTHNDRDHNLACVLAGRRRFILFPPEQVGNLYVGPLDNPPPLSLVDPEAPDLDRFPRFAEAIAAARVAWLEPGDAIFLPKYWWHHVTSLDPYNAMVNYWWGDGAAGIERAHECFLTALLALKDLPPGERSYWHAMFETYVFGPPDAAGHIPDALRGPLGTMSPAMRARLKQQLMIAFLRSP